VTERNLRVRINLDTGSVTSDAEKASRAIEGIGRSATGAASKASQASRDTQESLSRAASSADSWAGKMEKASSRAKQALGVAVVAAAGLAAKSIISLGMDYENNLNQLGAVTGATDAQMRKMGDTAKALGNSIELPMASASDAAQAMLALAKGGLSADQAMSAAKGTLTLAAAAQIDGATAAEIQSAALNTFGLAASEANRVADVLANTANASAGEMTDFAAGMAQSGLVAKAMGISIESTATALGIFANAGLSGSDAGTSFKSMLIALQAPSEKQAGAMEELGIKAFDASGKFVGMKVITGQLEAAQKRMTTEQYNAAAATAFGTDAVRAAVAIGAQGVTGWDKMTAAIGRVGGAQEVAAAQTKGLSGSWNQFVNGLETMALSIYERVSPALQEMLDGATSVLPQIAEFFAGVVNAGLGLVDFLTSIPGPVYAMAAAFGAVHVLKGPVGDFFSTVKGSVKGFGEEMLLQSKLASMSGQELSKAGSFMATAATRAKSAGSAVLGAFGGPWGVAIGAAVSAVGFLGSAYKDAEPKVVDFTDVIDTQTGALKKNAREVIAKKLADSDSFKYAKEAGVSLDLYTSAVMGNKDALAQLNDMQAASKANFERIQAAQMAATTSTSKYGAQAQETAQVVSDGSAPYVAMSQMMAQLNQNQKDFGTDQAKIQDALTATSGALPAATTMFDLFGAEIAAAGAVATAAATDMAPLPPAVVSMEDAMKAFGEGTKKAKQQVDFFQLSMDTLAGRTPNYDQALKSYNDQVRGLADAFKEADDATKGKIDSLVNLDGTINTVSEAGSNFYDSMEAMGESTRNNTIATFQHSKAMTDEATGLKDARAFADQARDAFIRTAVAKGMNITEAEKLATRLGILKGIDIPDKTFGIVADPAPAVAAVDAVNAKAVRDKEFTITADFQANVASVNALLRSQGNIFAQAAGGYWENGIQHAAAGLHRDSKMVPGGANLVHWAEPSIPWETYISGDPSQKQRSDQLMTVTAARLGGEYWPAGPPNARDMFSASQYAPAPAVAAGNGGEMKLADNLQITGYPNVMDALHKTMYKLGNLRMGAKR
jgi:TP901 family phage tail tape measure protein